ICEVALKHMWNVEVGRSIVRPRIVGVLIVLPAVTASPTGRILVVQHAGPGVVQIELQTGAEPLGYRKLCGIVIRSRVKQVAVDRKELRIRPQSLRLAGSGTLGNETSRYLIQIH